MEQRQKILRGTMRDMPLDVHRASAIEFRDGALRLIE